MSLLKFLVFSVVLIEINISTVSRTVHLGKDPFGTEDRSLSVKDSRGKKMDLRTRFPISQTSDLFLRYYDGPIKCP